MIYESKNFRPKLRFVATRLKVYFTACIQHTCVKVCASSRTLNVKIYLAWHDAPKIIYALAVPK